MFFRTWEVWNHHWICVVNLLIEVTGLVLNHNARLCELKAKIRTEIREGLGERSFV